MFTREKMCVEYKKQHGILDGVLVSSDHVTSAFCVGYSLGQSSSERENEKLREALSDLLDGYTVLYLVDGEGFSEERAREIFNMINIGDKQCLS